MATYLCNADGSLYSWDPNDGDPVADDATLAAKGLTKLTGLPALDASHVWDAASKTVITVTPAAPQKWVQTYQFILLFTPAENAAIRSSSDDGVQHFFDALRSTQNIDLNNPIVQNGVADLVSLGLITQSRANAILADQQPSQ